MKTRFIFLFLAVFGLGIGAHAQESSNGLRAGWSNAVLSAGGKQVAEYNGLNGFYVGTFRTDKIIPLLHWYKGLEYQQMGDRLNDNTFRRLHYISLPQAARLKVGPLFAQVGIAINFKVGETREAAGVDIKTDENKAEWYDFPWHTGLGLKLGPITVDARYHWGLNNIDDTGLRNQYFQVGAGISF